MMRGSKSWYPYTVQVARESEASVTAGDDIIPACYSAAGRCLLAQLTNREVEQIYKGGLPDWPCGRITSVRSLKRFFGKIRSRGFATSFGEAAPQVNSLAIATSVGGYLQGALTIAVHSSGYHATLFDEYLELLHETNRDLCASVSSTDNAIKEPRFAAVPYVPFDNPNAPPTGGHPLPGDGPASIGRIG